MKTISAFARRILSDDNGATAIEYGLLAGLISIMIIGGATLAGTEIDRIFDTVGNSLVAVKPAAT